MAGGFWKSTGNDLRNNLSGGRMEFSGYGGQNLMNRGYSNGMGSNAAALNFLKGMANQHADLNQRNDRGQYQTGLDCYGTSRSFSGHFQGAAQRSGMDPYNAINPPLVDSYRDYVDNSHSFNTFYMPRDSFMDRLPQSGMAQYSAAERNMYASGANQGGQFGSQSPQVAGRKRAGGWESGRGGAFQIPPNQVSNNRSKKGKVSQAPSMSNASKMKPMSASQNNTSLPLDADIIKALRCVVCNIDSFSNVQEFKSHVSDKPHLEVLEAAKLRNAANLEYLRSEAKLAARRYIIECRRKGQTIPKLSHCSICRCDYFGTYAIHKLTVEHDQICKFDNARCCGRVFSGYDKLTEHETTFEHFQTWCRDQMLNPKTDGPGKLEDFAEGKIFNIGINSITPYVPHKQLGKQVLSEHEGFICELCPESHDFTLDGIKQHCTSLSHYHQIINVLSEKSGKSEADIKKELKNKLKYVNEKILEDDVEYSHVHLKSLETLGDEDNHQEKICHGIEDIDEDALDFENI